MPRRKIHNPAAQALSRRIADLEAVSLPSDAATLPRQASIEITRAGERRGGDDKKADHDVAKRADAFDALKHGMSPGAYDAARRFEMDVLTRLGIGDKGIAVERVDCDPDFARAIRRAMAGERVDAIRSVIPKRDFWLLMELVAPVIDRGTWRDHVAYVTGLYEPMPQGQAVKDACAQLVKAYEDGECKAAA